MCRLVLGVSCFAPGTNEPRCFQLKRGRASSIVVENKRHIIWIIIDNMFWMQIYLTINDSHSEDRTNSVERCPSSSHDKLERIIFVFMKCIYIRKYYILLFHFTFGQILWLFNGYLNSLHRSLDSCSLNRAITTRYLKHI